MGTFTLLETVCRHEVRFHHISAGEIYGGLELDDPAKFTLITSYNPSSPYSSSKAGPDLLVRTWMCSFGAEVTVSDCSDNYSPYQHIEKFILHMITNRLRGMHPRLYDDGLNMRGWIHMRDHNMAVWGILMKSRIDEAYLISANDETNNRDVVAILDELMGCVPDDFDHVADHPGRDLYYTIDNSKLVTGLSWKPQFTNFRDGLANAITWYTKSEAWWAPLKEAIETKYAAEEH